MPWFLDIKRKKFTKKIQEIPKNIPENPMAPPAVPIVRPAINRVITISYSLNLAVNSFLEPNLECKERNGSKLAMFQTCITSS
jgi:hypothetical protein